MRIDGAEVVVDGNSLCVVREDRYDSAYDISVSVRLDRNARDYLVDALMRIQYHEYVIYANIHADGKNMWSTMHLEDGSGEAIFTSAQEAMKYMHERATRAFKEWVGSEDERMIRAHEGDTTYEWYVVRRENA